MNFLFLLLICCIIINIINGLDNYRQYLFQELDVNQRNIIKNLFANSPYLSSFSLSKKKLKRSNASTFLPTKTSSLYLDDNSPRVLFIVRAYHGHFKNSGVYNIYHLLNSLMNLNYKNWNAIIFNTDNIPIPGLPKPYSDDNRISILNSELDKFMKKTNKLYTRGPYPSDLDVNLSKFPFNPLFVNNNKEYLHTFDEWKAGYEVTDRILDLLNYFPSDIFDYLVVTNGDNYYYPEFLDVFKTNFTRNSYNLREATDNINYEEDVIQYNLEFEDFIQDRSKLPTKYNKTLFDIYIFKYYSRYQQNSFIPVTYSSIMTEKGYKKLNLNTNTIATSNAPFMSYLDTAKYTSEPTTNMTKDVCHTPILARGYVDLGGAILNYYKFQDENLRFLKFGEVNAQDGLLFNLISNYYYESTYYTKFNEHLNSLNSLGKNPLTEFIDAELMNANQDTVIPSLKYFFPNIANIENTTYKQLLNSFIYVSNDNLNQKSSLFSFLFNKEKTSPSPVPATQPILLKKWSIKFIDKCYFSHSPNPYSCTQNNGAWYVSSVNRNELGESCWAKDEIEHKVSAINNKIIEHRKTELTKYHELRRKMPEIDTIYRLYKKYKLEPYNLKHNITTLTPEHLKIINEAEKKINFAFVFNTTILELQKEIQNSMLFYSLPPQLHHISAQKSQVAKDEFFRTFISKLFNQRRSYCEVIKQNILSPQYYLLKNVNMVFVPYNSSTKSIYFSELNNNDQNIRGKIIFIHNTIESIKKFKEFNKKNNIDINSLQFFKFYTYNMYNVYAANPDIYKDIVASFRKALDFAISSPNKIDPIPYSAPYSIANYFKISASLIQLHYKSLLDISNSPSYAWSVVNSPAFLRALLTTSNNFFLPYFHDTLCMTGKPIDIFTPRNYFTSHHSPADFLVPIDVNGNRIHTIQILF